MPTKTTNIAVANLSVAEKYFDHFDAEMHTDTSGSNRVAVIDNIPGIWNAGTSRFDQRNVIYFKNCVLGTTYQFRFRCIDKYGNVSAWSGWISEVAGDTTAPAPSYATTVTSFPGGVILRATPTGAPSDLDRYEHYWNLTGSSPSSTTLPNLPNSIDGVCTIMLSAADTGNAWVRAVDTSGNKQAWTSQGAFLSTDGVPYLFPSGKNMIPNAGFESNVAGIATMTNLSVGSMITDSWLVNANDSNNFIIKIETTSAFFRSGAQSVFIGLSSSASLANGSTYYGKINDATKLPVAIGDIVRVSGYYRYDRGAAPPGGVTFIIALGLDLFNAAGTLLGGIIASTTTLASTFPLLQSAVIIPATIGGGVPAYGQFVCWLQATNTSGSTQTPSGAFWADVRFDDVKCVLQNTAFDLTPLNTSGRSTTNAGKLSQVGVTAQINVATTTMQYGADSGVAVDGQITYNAGSVTPGGLGTWFVYADDPTYSGGAVTYVATANESEVYANNGRIPFGQITTVGGGGGASINAPGTGGGRLRLPI